MCFFFKQKTAYEMRISDWSSDVCSSDLRWRKSCRSSPGGSKGYGRFPKRHRPALSSSHRDAPRNRVTYLYFPKKPRQTAFRSRSEEHTSELQSLMRISYAVFCLKKKTAIMKLATQHVYNTLPHTHNVL